MMDTGQFNLDDIEKIKKYFLITLGVIAVFGIIMVLSTSFIYAREYFGSSTYFFLRQIIFLLMGVGLASVIGMSKFSFWVKYGKYLNILCAVVLLSTLIPGIGVSLKGASRWINFFGMRLQPGEIVKYSLIISSVSYFENFSKLELKENIKYAVSLLFPLAVFMIQPDFGSFFISFLVLAFVCFMSSFPRKYFYWLFAGGGIFGILFLFTAAYRVKRLFAYLDPWANSQGSGFQLVQSFYAFANGGFFGLGIGNSNQKLFYLPEVHNDFIFSAIGEEFGFFGVLMVALLFLALVYFGLKIVMLIKGRKSQIVVAAVVFVIGIQAFLNMAVVLGVIPTKGLNLPFISYGGSSLLSNFFGIGLILSAIRQHKRVSSNVSGTSSFNTVNSYSSSNSYSRRG